MKKLLLSFMAIFMLLSLVACGGTQLPTDAEEEEKEEMAEEVKEEEVMELEYADTLKINFAMGNNARTMTYQQANPLTLEDGTVIAQGDLKPTWQYIQEQMGFTIEDVTIQDQKATEMIDLSAATGFKDATVYGGNSIAEDLMNYGAQGYFINLSDYLKYMPNFNAYLEANPNVATSITAYDGGVYHIPYVAEIDNYARVFAGRAEWVQLLLDSEDQLVDETATLTTAYTGYWDRNASNVIDLQNEAAGGTLDRATALSVLVEYIDATYPELENRSDLYVGETAAFDIDELVALWRVIELSPNTLSKQVTGEVVDGANISAFFTRKSRFREDLMHLINYFGGQKAHASDSYFARLYVDENGEMQYSYANDKFLEGVDQLSNIYAEGLIHSEFADLSVTDDFRKAMFFSDAAEGQQQFGFMTYDWIGSTTASNDAIVGFLPPVTTIEAAGITDFVHFVENSRVIKPDGWSISAAASEEEINAAVKLFDYMFSREGQVTQIYSIPSTLVEGEVFVGADGTEYPKFSQWLLDTADEFKSGNVPAFLRDFMGSLLHIGYQKEIGFELQYTSENGFAAWELYTDADVMKTTYGATNQYFKLMPPIISLNDQELAKLGTVSVGTDQVDLMFQYIVGADGAVASVDEIAAAYDQAGIDTYLDVYAGAYERQTSK